MAWARTHKLIATLIPVLVIVLAVGAAIASSGGGKTGTTAASSASGKDSSVAGSGTAGSGTAGSGTIGSGAGKSGAAASSGSSHGGGSITGVGRPVHAPTQPAVTKGEKWVTGPAGKLLSAVNADVGKIGADQRAGKDRAAKDLGALLTADAKAALDGPMPPVDTAVYRTALEDFEQIGKDTASGNFSKTSSLLTTANLEIINVTTAANLAAPVNSAAQVNDPSDR
jgi:hypothetical protein